MEGKIKIHFPSVLVWEGGGVVGGKIPFPIALTNDAWYFGGTP